MCEINFYLKKKEPKTGKCLIYLQYKYSGFKLVFSFGQTIDPQLWHKGKQRVKSNQQTTKDGQHALNNLLDKLASLCRQTYYAELEHGIPAPDKIKAALRAFVGQNKPAANRTTFFGLIDRFIKGEIHHEGKEKALSTLKKYGTAKTHLALFSKEEGFTLSFESIDLEFYNRFVSFLRRKGLAQNTIAKTIQVIKTFMNEAVDLGYTKNLQHRHRKFAVSWEEVDAVYLTENEIQRLFQHDFLQDKKLERTRDLFVFGTQVGLRFIDYSAVKPENIIVVENEGLKEKFIRIVAQKTGQLVIIPCSPMVLEIFDRYKNNPNQLPKAYSNQAFNRQIREVCRIAGLTQTGRLLSHPEKELWEVVSSHTCRRSFCTNLFLSGFPTLEIMKISGHTSEKNFLKYVKVSKIDTAKRLSRHFKLLALAKSQAA